VPVLGVMCRNDVWLIAEAEVESPARYYCTQRPGTTAASPADPEESQGLCADELLNGERVVSHLPCRH
jgi:hypothetical protein